MPGVVAQSEGAYASSAKHANARIPPSTVPELINTLKKSVSGFFGGGVIKLTFPGFKSMNESRLLALNPKP